MAARLEAHRGGGGAGKLDERVVARRTARDLHPHRGSPRLFFCARARHRTVASVDGSEAREVGQGRGVEANNAYVESKHRVLKGRPRSDFLGEDGAFASRPWNDLKLGAPPSRGEGGRSFSNRSKGSTQGISVPPSDRGRPSRTRCFDSTARVRILRLHTTPLRDFSSLAAVDRCDCPVCRGRAQKKLGRPACVAASRGRLEEATLLVRSARSIIAHDTRPPVCRLARSAPARPLPPVCADAPPCDLLSVCAQGRREASVGRGAASYRT